MFTRLAAATGALLLASGPVMASSSENATAVWNTDNISNSCSLTFVSAGKAVPNGKTGSQALLDSTVSGGRPSTIKYDFTMYNNSDKGYVGFARNGASVTRNGNATNILAGHHNMHISYNGGAKWVETFQNTQINTYTNQKNSDRFSVTGSKSANLDIDVKTDAHTAQNNNIIPGTYVIKQVMECLY